MIPSPLRHTSAGALCWVVPCYGLFWRADEITKQRVVAAVDLDQGEIAGVNKNPMKPFVELSG
jgi:hypothetical protein